MKYKYNNEWKEMNVKVSDTLPIGSIVEYDGDTVPIGYEEVNGYSTNEVMKIKKVYQSSASAFKFESFQEFTPTIKYATMTYTTRYGKYKHLDENTIMGVVALRGNITSVTEPGYARIKVNIPGVTSSNVQSWESFGIIQEALRGTDETPYSAGAGVEDGGDIVIGLQRSGGTTVAKWIVENDVYIKVVFIINMAN